MTSLHSPSTKRAKRRLLGAGALAIPVFLLAGCSGPDALPIEELVRRGDAYLHPVTLQPYSGPVFAAYQRSPRRIERRASLVDGQYDGAFELYFENRRLSLREVYRHGEKDGPYEWYLENGQLYERGTYQNGLREGPYEAYFEDGRLLEKGTYRGGDFHGSRKWYFDGQLIERVTYVHGRIDGPYERYAVDGTLLLRGTLLDGDPCGVWTERDARVVHPTCTYVSD